MKVCRRGTGHCKLYLIIIHMNHQIIHGGRRTRMHSTESDSCANIVINLLTSGGLSMRSLERLSKRVMDMDYLELLLFNQEKS